jgi:hypothetical protein
MAPASPLAPLVTISVAGLLTLDHKDSGDDSISRSNVELKDFSRLGGSKDRR